jgi:hypothetical protein
VKKQPKLRHPGFRSTEPPCPLDEDRFKGCFVRRNGELVYYINRRAKAAFLWNIWLTGATSPEWDDPDLCNDYYPALASANTWVPYSETVVIEDHRIEWRDAEFPQGYRITTGVVHGYSANRLDFYVTRSEFADAYRAVWRLGRTLRGTYVSEVCIFNHLRVVLLDDAAFAELAEEPPLVDGIADALRT